MRPHGAIYKRLQSLPPGWRYGYFGRNYAKINMSALTGWPNEVGKVFDSNYFRKIGCIVAGAVLFNWALQNIATIFALLGKTVNLINPFLIGLGIAFILNIPMQVLENRLFKKVGAKLRRLLSLFVTILLILALILLVLLAIIPEIGQTFETLLAMFPGFIVKVAAWGQQLSAKFPNLGVWLSKVALDWESIGTNAFNFMKNWFAGMMNSTVSAISTFFSGVLNFFLGSVFALYILFQKENLARQARKLLYASVPEAKADRFVTICALANKTFSRFITGQCTEAVILGLMFFAALNLFRFPYAMAIAVLITCTALIPVFGAFIACFIGAFLILVTSPIKAFWFIALFLVLQQIEGNLIYPRVVGGSVGLPALWVMAAVIIGGGTMGITGMLVSVPLCSVLYVLLRESVGKRLAEKNIPPEKTSS